MDCTLNTYVVTYISISFNSMDCLSQIRGGDWQDADGQEFDHEGL